MGPISEKMAVCIIDDDFTIDVEEDPTECDNEWLSRYIEERKKHCDASDDQSEDSNNAQKNLFLAREDDFKMIEDMKAKQAECSTEKINNISKGSDKSGSGDNVARFSKTCKSYKCNQCFYEIEGQKTYREHMKAHLDYSKLFKCKYCEHTTSTKSALSLHLAKCVFNDKRVKCPQCSFVTSKYKHLTAHKQKYHSNVKQGKGTISYKCPCLFVTLQRREYYEHKKKCHRIEIKCKKCQFIASTKLEYFQHMRSHGKERKKKKKEVTKVHKVKLYACDICSYESKYISNVARHRTKHVQEILEN